MHGIKVINPLLPLLLDIMFINEVKIRLME